LTGIKSGADRPSNAITYWMPIAVFALVIVFVISLILKLPSDRTLVASALAAGTVFSGFFTRSFFKDKDTST
jgi:hypothetical protein